MKLSIIIKKLRDKKVDAIIEFFSRFKIHLTVLKPQLRTCEHTVLSYLYSHDIQKAQSLSCQMTCQFF